MCRDYRGKPQLMLVCLFSQLCRFQGDGTRSTTQTEGGATAQEGKETPEESAPGKGMSVGEDELLLARQSALAYCAALERQSLLLLHECQQQHVLLSAHHQRDAQLPVLRVHHGLDNLLQFDYR